MTPRTARILDATRRVMLALLTVALIALLRWILSPLLGGQGALILFIPAIMLTTWYGGWGPGLIAMALAVSVGSSVEPHPAAIFTMRNHQAFRAVLFLAVGLQIVITTDLLHRRTKQARAASKAKDLFISILSHELRTPLTPAALIAAELAEDEKIPQGVRQQARIIQRNIALEVRLIDDLLDISRIQKGKLQLHREILDLDRCMDEAIQICAPAIDSKNLHVRFHSTGGPHHVNADPARLKQIFWNLLRNAIKFTPDGGFIGINITADSDTLNIQITDSGIGINPSDLSRIFRAFEQGRDSSKRQFGGLGLGLAISRALVELHGGSIHAASEGIGRGATFVVKLPQTSFVPVAENAPEGQIIPSRKLHILLVEDHADTLLVMARLLERMGHEVTGASTVAEAEAAAMREPFDLILSDLSLPDGSGADLLARLRAHGKQVTAIAISGHGTAEDIKRSRAAGFSEHLSKPLDIPMLQRTIVTMAGPPPSPSTARRLARVR